ncbi:MAG: SulP family inorganic anion transporter [Candidatus Promineifilaceae bacterium]
MDSRPVFRYGYLVPTLTSGLIAGLLEVALAVSFGALIFGGTLSTYVPYGVGYALVGAIIGGLIIALFTSLPGMVGGNQDVPAAIMALMAVAIREAMPTGATTEQTFFTVIAAVAISTILTGLLFWATGYFRLGNLARFLPYPVVGGFLAGTGWLLAAGAISLMTGLSLVPASLPDLLQPELLLRWLPGLFLAVGILAATNRFQHVLVLPGLLVFATALFFVIARAWGYSLDELSAGGWLLGPFSAGGLWRPLTPAILGEVYWPAVARQVATMATIALVSTVSLLLNASGVELAVASDIDLDRELRVAGLANFLSGLAVALVGFQQLAFSILNHRLRANNRLTGVLSAAVCLLALVAGASLLALFPKVIAGSLILFLGLSFINEWVIEGWSKLPHTDYAIVVAILLATVFIGFLEAVAFGLLLALVLFVVGYSRVDVVRHELSGKTYHSRVARSRAEELLLRQHGEALYVLQLQGFLFFGTADTLLQQVRDRLTDAQRPPPMAVIFDFEAVNGLDTTATMRFLKMRDLAAVHSVHAAHGVLLLICGTGLHKGERIRRQLTRGGLDGSQGTVRYFDTIDDGMAWAEDLLLAQLAAEATVTTQDSEALLASLLSHFGGTREVEGRAAAEAARMLETMLGYFEKLDLAANTVFIREGEEAGSFYILAAGQATARISLPDGSFIRLETMGSGRVIGELGFFLDNGRTADVVTDKPSTLYRLTRENLARMEAHDPAAAAALYRLLAGLLAERVIHLTDTVRALGR